MKYRTLTAAINKAIKTFPATVVTGPRQSGKTTLLKNIFGKDHQYVNLDNLDIRLRAKEDPKGFLSQYHRPLIIDEIQYAPELLPYIKTAIDNDRQPGHWLLTGSQNFVLMHGVSESLAGRAAVLSLLPFTLAERCDLGKQDKLIKNIAEKKLKTAKKITPVSIDLLEIIMRGFYPEIASNIQVDRQLWFNSYITTYVERDIRNLTQVADLNQFERFFRACAVRTGQILDLTSIAREIGISVPTAKRWLSLLETGYQVYLLYPYYKNIGKRLVKSPKIYFIDVGIASFLLGLHSAEMLVASPYFSFLFETFIVIDFLKKFYNSGITPSMYYLRTRDGLEVDLVIEANNKLHLFEMKSSATITFGHASSLRRAVADFGQKIGSASLISNAKESFSLTPKIINYHWQDILLI